MSDNLPEHIDSNSYPDFWEQMKNFQSFAKKVGQEGLSSVKDGGIFLTKEEYENRMNICDKCPQFDHKRKRCHLCGCFMEHKAKFRAAECPSSKW